MLSLTFRVGLIARAPISIYYDLRARWTMSAMSSETFVSLHYEWKAEVKKEAKLRLLGHEPWPIYRHFVNFIYG